MTKKIAVLIRDRQEEALRMAIGLTLMDDSIEIYLPNRKLSRNDKNALNLETIQEMDIPVFSNVEQEAGVQMINAHELGNRLLECDHVLPY